MFPHHGTKNDFAAWGNSRRSVPTASSASARTSEETTIDLGDSSTSFRQTAMPTSPPPPRTTMVFPWISICKRMITSERCSPKRDRDGRSSDFLQNDRCPVSQYFGHSGGDFICIVPHADDRVRPD